MRKDLRSQISPASEKSSERIKGSSWRPTRRESRSGPLHRHHRKVSHTAWAQKVYRQIVGFRACEDRT